MYSQKNTNTNTCTVVDCTNEEEYIHHLVENQYKNTVSTMFNVQIHKHINTQIHKHKYSHANTEVKKYKYKCTCSQPVHLKSNEYAVKVEELWGGHDWDIYTNTNTHMQIQIQISMYVYTTKSPGVQ